MIKWVQIKSVVDWIVEVVALPHLSLTSQKHSIRILLRMLARIVLGYQVLVMCDVQLDVSAASVLVNLQDVLV